MNTYLKKYISDWNNNVKYACSSFKIPYHNAEELLSRAIWRITYRMQIEKMVYKFDSYLHFRRFVFKITKNILIDDTRRRKIDIKYVEHYLNPEADQLPEHNKEVRKQIYKLPGRIKKVAILRTWGLKYREISDSLDMPVGTVKNYIHITKKMLT
jgi:DNA-directed RNA polymerase specialized sigma24 family protein